MKQYPWRWFLLGWVLLQACAGASAPSFSSFAHETAGSGGQEAVALGPGFRFPRPAKPPAPSKPTGAPKTEPPATNAPAARPPSPEKPSPAPASPAQTPAQQKPTVSSPTARGFLDPKVARTLFDQGMAEAKRRFPHLYGKPKQEHHIHPKYLNGPENGPTVDLDPAYHQLITNAFREEYGYGQVDPPPPGEQQKIMRKVYSRYPLPGIHF
ncbi:hypothetical protein [Archangium sp.]|uniref:hypothetical protein n=1 Tax=Archangium sp. TaxID=1872627 RepID=UPI002D431CEF|nr:hypothetical protein [Archangium sp.]HYO56598.1 hypothetical protein [Archangium sp.]